MNKTPNTKPITITNTTNNIGILDPKGKNQNPLTSNDYSDKYRQLGKVWEKFPAYAHPQEMIDKIKNNQVILVVSGTGSGKTVLFPKYAIHALNYNGRVAITLPKQDVTKSAAIFAAETLDVKLGEEVGYQYRGSEKGTKSSKTKMLYCTDGTLIARLANDAELKEFDIVIIDEAHERKVNIDLLLFMMRNVLRKRPDFKLIIMSATINEDIFKKYYQEFSLASVNIGTKPNYPIKSIFLESNLNQAQYIEAGKDIIKGLLKNHKSGKSPNQGGIMFFVTSGNETEKTCDQLKSNGDLGDANTCVPFFAKLNEDKKKLVTDDKYYKLITTGDGIKIIITTNAAESSLTVDGITDVIDSGLELKSRYDPISRVTILEKTLITQAQAKQRMGRTGRTGPGKCFHLYTEENFNTTMEKYPSPAIKVESINFEILRLMSLQSDTNTLGDIKKLLGEFIEPPDKYYVDAEIQFLFKMNMITDDTNKGILTEYGKLTVGINADPCTTMALIYGYKLRCFREVLSIMCIIDSIKGSIDNLFTLPPDILSESNDNSKGSEKEKGRTKWLTTKFIDAKKQFNNKYGDHIAILKIFGEFEKNRKDPDKLQTWAYKNFISKKTLENAYQRYISLKHRIMSKLEKYSLSGTKQELLETDIKYRVIASIALGFKLNRAKISEDKIKILEQIEVRGDHTKSQKLDNIQLDKNGFINHELSNGDIIVYNLLHMMRDGGRKHNEKKKDTIKAKIVTIVPKISTEIIKQL